MRSGSDVLQPLRSAGPFLGVAPMASIDIKVLTDLWLILCILPILAILLQTL